METAGVSGIAPDVPELIIEIPVTAPVAASTLSTLNVGSTEYSVPGSTTVNVSPTVYPIPPIATEPPVTVLSKSASVCPRVVRKPLGLVMMLSGSHAEPNPNGSLLSHCNSLTGDGTPVSSTYAYV